MEVIVRGTRLEEREKRAQAWRRVIRHRRCGSVLRIGADDLWPASDYQGWRTYCAVCQRKIRLHFLPGVVRESATRRYDGV